jgi:hypothetical protein
MLFVCLQTALTYRLAKTQREYGVAHLRLTMSLLAFTALVLSILLKTCTPPCQPIRDHPGFFRKKGWGGRGSWKGGEE